MAVLDLETELKRGYEALARHAAGEADAVAALVIGAAPESVDGYRLLARVRLGRDDVPGAITTLEEATRKAREPLAAFVDLADLHIKRQEGTRALSAALAARELGGDLVRFVMLSGQARWVAGRTAEALVDFELAAPSAPDRIDVQLPLARAYAALGRDADALRVLDAFLVRRPNGAAAALRTHLRFDPADPATALNEAEAALRTTSEDPELRLLTAALCVLNDDTRADHFRSGLDADPRLKARWAGFASLHAAGCQFVGLPTRVLEHALDAATVAGHSAEFGVFAGRSLAVIAARTDGAVHGFDSFHGTPAGPAPAGAFDLAGIAPLVPANVALHIGPFADTLPDFATAAGPARFWHVDCDHAPSTRLVLETLAATLVPGSVIVFDDYTGFPDADRHDQGEWLEFVARRGIRWKPFAATLLGREVAIRIEEIR